VFALILYVLLGWRAALAELLGELLLCTILLGGGGGSRVVAFLRSQRTRFAIRHSATVRA
jgi:hypothetical protein